MAGMRDSLRDRFDFAPGQHRPNKIRTGAIFVALTVIFLWVLYTKPSVPFFGADGTELTFDVASGANVRPGYTPVRVRGVEVGQVTDIERAPSGRGAHVTVKVEDGKGVDLREDARVAVRWRTLLGRNMYIDLNPGSPSAPRYSGGLIPRSRTTDQVELDTALEPLDAKGRGALQTMITEFDKAFADPAAVQSAVDGVAPAMRGAAEGLPGLRGEEPGDLAMLVTNASRALGELSRDEVALGDLVTGGAGALGVTAARRADLASTLVSAPAAMREARATLTRLEQTLDEVDPLADELRPGLDKLATASRNTQRALDVARPLLADLRPTLALARPALADLRTAATKGIPSFGPINNTMRMAQDDVIPFLEAKDPATKRVNYTNIGPLASHAGSATSWGDRFGTLANFEAAAGENAPSFLPCETYFKDPEVATSKKIQCELMSRALIALFEGKKPQDVKVAAGLPMSKISKYLTGKALLELPKSRSGR